MQTTHLLLADGGEGTSKHSKAVGMGLPIISEDWIVLRTSPSSSPSSDSRDASTSQRPSKVYFDDKRMTLKTWKKKLLDNEASKCDMWRHWSIDVQKVTIVCVYTGRADIAKLTKLLRPTLVPKVQV